MYEEDRGERAPVGRNKDGGSVDGDWYEEVAVNCFRYLGYRSLDEVDRMTVREYRLRMKAFRFSEVDQEFRVHEQAYLVQAASATTPAGKPKYKKFKDFFNYRKELRKAEDAEHPKTDSRFLGMAPTHRKEGE